jgi:hypothetical protein
VIGLGGLSVVEGHAFVFFVWGGGGGGGFTFSIRKYLMNISEDLFSCF